MEPKTKVKIRAIVSDYKKMFPNEYKAVTEQIALSRHKLQDSEFGTISGEHALQRALYEIPETLDAMLTIYLTETQLKEFKAKGEESKKNARWFAKTFKEFALPSKI